jgi:hypothetical protein
MSTRLRQILASEGFRIAASPLDASVKEAMKKGQFVGDPKIGSYTVAPEGIVVEVTVSVVVPPSKALAAAPPKQTLKMVFGKPELLSEIPESVLKTIPFKAMKPAQFTTFVKKMGGLGQYSDEVLRALLEGRKVELDEDYAPMVNNIFEADPKAVASYVGGDTGEPDDWGGGEMAEIQIKKGVVSGVLFMPYVWENGSGLTIKRDVPDAPYIDLDRAVHGQSPEDSTHLAGVKWLDGEDRVETLPKGTPGITRVSVQLDFPMKPLTLASMPRKDLEILVKAVAKGS